MPHDERGAGLAIDHWRGLEWRSPRRESSRRPPGRPCSSHASEVKTMGQKDQTGPRDGSEGLEGFPVLRREVAGLDVGSEQHWVCAPAREGGGRDVAVFAATTPGV